MGHGGISTACSLIQQNDVFLEICLVLTTRQEYGAIQNSAEVMKEASLEYNRFLWTWNC